MSIAQPVSCCSPVLPSWQAPDEGARWYAIHTVSQHEKRVTALLGEKRIFSFLPLLDQIHHWSDRRKVVQVPLFSCYTFVRVSSTPETRMQVLRTPGVIDFVGVQGRGIPIPDDEIEGIRTVLREKIACGLHPFIQAGKRVRVRGGALDGVEGVFEEHDSQGIVVLSVNLLRRSLFIRVEGYDFEPA